jgi:hypothetical protein
VPEKRWTIAKLHAPPDEVRNSPDVISARPAPPIDQQGLNRMAFFQKHCCGLTWHAVFPWSTHFQLDFAPGVLNFCAGAMVLFAPLAMARFPMVIRKWTAQPFGELAAFAIAAVVMFIVARLIELLVLRHRLTRKAPRC